MRDPRGGKGIHVQLEGDGAWTDMEHKTIWRAREIHVAALARGTVEGRASVAIRFDLSGDKVAIAECTLREFNAVHLALVGRYGEDFMKGGQPGGDIEMRLSLTIQELIRQLTEAKARLGEPPVIDFTAADRAYDEMIKALQGGAS